MSLSIYNIKYFKNFRNGNVKESSKNFAFLLIFVIFNTFFTNSVLKFQFYSKNFQEISHITIVLGDDIRTIRVKIYFIGGFPDATK